MFKTDRVFSVFSSSTRDRSGLGVDDIHIKMTGMLVVSGVKIADFYFTCLGRENDIYTCKDIT